MEVTALQGDTVDLICYRHTGRTAGVVEMVLQMNRGLADTVILEAGQKVRLPDPDTLSTTTRETISLWE
ncbi:TPA: tail protein X [Escherichia coli]|nr:tail protein X [Escherichia coli]